MSHEFESGFFVRQEAWHGLGTVLENPPSNAREAIKAAGLDWKVEKRPLYFKKGESKLVFPDKYALVRTSDNTPLNVVAESYEILQNSEAFHFFDPAVESGIAQYETAGSLRNGQHIWVLADLKKRVDIQRGDPVSRYLLFTNSHGAGKAVQVLCTSIRVVCMNTLRMATMRTGDEIAKIRHQGNMVMKLEEVQQLVAKANETFEHEEKVFMDWSKIPLSSQMVDDMLDVLYPSKIQQPGEDEGYGVARNRQNIAGLVESGTGANLGKKSLWTLYNACIEHADYYTGQKSVGRAFNVMMSTGKIIRDKAYETAVAISLTK